MIAISKKLGDIDAVLDTLQVLDATVSQIEGSGQLSQVFVGQGGLVKDERQFVAGLAKGRV